MNAMTATNLPIPVPEYGETDNSMNRCIDCRDPLREGERVQCDICNGAVEDLFVYDMEQIINQSDLDWIARNIHDWAPASTTVCIRGSHPNPTVVWDPSDVDSTFVFTRDQWLARRAELQNKPSWSQAPNGYQYLCQDKDGVWKFIFGGHGAPRCNEVDENGVTGLPYWIGDIHHPEQQTGEVLGDWRNTLERRPEHAAVEFNPTASSLTDSQQRELSAATKMCSDGGHCGLGGFCRECPNVNNDLPDVDDTNVVESDHSVEATDMVGQKFDTDKPRFDLIPPRAERLLAEVLTFGAKKYAPGNWQHVEDAETRYIAAALRHINAHRTGEHSDDETGLPHLAHAMCCLAFVIELQEREFEGVMLELELKEATRESAA